ncbi:MAG TPA: hypothetical protein VHZ32_00905 [Rhizomicrobium sp.]|jgi:hypothetical protein|nr:hypothetical protein [Rhizomicrobium sp.]
MKKRLLVCVVAFGMAGGAAMPAAAAPWTRGFVVGTYEYAFRYGGRADYTRGTEVEPGADCPHGSTIHFASPDQTRIAMARQKWRSRQEIDWIANPPGVDKVAAPGLTRRHIWVRAMAYRGYRRGIETYVNPWAAEDPGQPEVTGRIGDGFNLDGKTGVRDFISPDGERGIDNALYRAWGCDAPWRGNGNATLDLRANDKMQEGLYTMVIRVSGNADPMNDDKAMVEIGYSPDKIVKDARGGIARDYSYRILKSAQYTRLKARIKNGMVETEQVPELHSPRIAWFYDQTGDADFRQGKMRLTIAADGVSARALIGGYRDWRDLYAEDTFAQDGGQQGTREHEDHVALYYALRRNADGMFNTRTGRYDGISSAYRLTMASAFVVDAEAAMEIPKLAGEEDHKAAFEAIKLAVIRGADTRIPQSVPPGTTEAAVPALEHEMVGLSSKDYFLQTLDRPHYPGEDANGVPPWERRGEPAPPPPAKQQVRNEGSVVAAQN